jgi:hypothetical protein
LGVVLVGLSLLATRSGASVDRSGAYEVYRDGVRVGSERYAWNEGEDGKEVLQGECVLEVDGVSTTLRPSLTINTSMQPVAFDLSRAQGDAVVEIATRFNGGRADHTVRENGMESTKSLKISPADLVIDRDVLHLFLLLAERYDFEKGGEQDLMVFDVENRKTYKSHCRLRGLGTIENSAGKFRARRLTIDLEDLSVDLLVDKDGRVPQISIPMMRIEARLLGYSGGDKAQLVR